MCNKEIKIHQKKQETREYSPVCVGKIQIEWKREKKLFIVKKNKEKSQNKRNMKG